MFSKKRTINNIRLHNDILTQRTKLIPLQKRAIPVDKLVYVKNINKLQNTEEEIVTFICPASQFIFLKLCFETAYIFSFSSVRRWKWTVKENKLIFFFLNANFSLASKPTNMSQTCICLGFCMLKQLWFILKSQSCINVLLRAWMESILDRNRVWENK